MIEFWNAFPAVQKELEIINNKILDEMGKSHPIVKSALSEFIKNNGKMLRSGFFTICSQF